MRQGGDQKTVQRFQARATRGLRHKKPLVGNISRTRRESGKPAGVLSENLIRRGIRVVRQYQRMRPDPTDKANFALNNAVILQFLEQSFYGGLYYHDRWDGKYHAP